MLGTGMNDKYLTNIPAGQNEQTEVYIMARFTLPRDIYYGSNAIASLTDLDYKKAFVVTGGSSMQRTGFLKKVEDALAAGGMQVQVFDGVEPDPSIETVMRGA